MSDRKSPKYVTTAYQGCRVNDIGNMKILYGLNGGTTEALRGQKSSARELARAPRPILQIDLKEAERAFGLNDRGRSSAGV